MSLFKGISAALLVALSGCSSLAVNNSSDIADAGLLQNIAFVERLDQESGSFSTEIVDSMLGHVMLVEVRPAYYAASGRTCRRVVDQNSDARFLFCRPESGKWQSAEDVLQ